MDKTGLNLEERQVLKGLSDSAFALVYERTEKQSVLSLLVLLERGLGPRSLTHCRLDLIGDVQLRTHDKVFDIRAILLTHALLLCQKKDNQLLVKVRAGARPRITLPSSITSRCLCSCPAVTTRAGRPLLSSTRQLCGPTPATPSPSLSCTRTNGARRCTSLSPPTKRTRRSGALYSPRRWVRLRIWCLEGA